MNPDPNSANFDPNSINPPISNPITPNPPISNLITPNLGKQAKKTKQPSFIRLLRVLWHLTRYPKSTNSTPKKQPGRLIRTLLICLTFDIFFGSCTLVWHYLISFTETSDINLFDLISHGELLIISVAITAGAISTLLSSGKVSKDNTRSLFFFCVGLLNLLVTSGWFTSLNPSSKISNIAGFEKMSIFLYIVSIAVSINCRLIGEA